MPRGDMRTFWNFASADNLAFGSDSTLQLGRWIASRGWQRVLVITDRNLVAAGISSRIEGILRESGLNVSVFDGGRHEPDIRTANLAFASAQAFLPDVLVGLGGGSNLDLAKMSGILMAHGGKPEDYFGHERVPGPVAPVICIPTTAGTGSEVSHSSVLTDEINGVKVSTLSQFLRPTLAVVDPKLTLTCPPKATADSGIDALTHAIEAFTAIDHRQLDAAPGEPFPYSGKCRWEISWQKRPLHSSASIWSIACINPSRCRTGKAWHWQRPSREWPSATVRSLSCMLSNIP